MFRETLMGVALENTLRTMKAGGSVSGGPSTRPGRREGTAAEGQGGEHPHDQTRDEATGFTEEQCKLIWEAFDGAMEDMLREVPASSVAVVRCGAPSSPAPTTAAAEKTPTARASSNDSTGGTRDGDAPPAPMTIRPPATANDRYPLYRCVDGKWTIILRNPTVTLATDTVGLNEETFKLDYLQIEAQEVVAAPPSSSHRTSDRGGGGGGGRKRGRV